MFYPSSLLTDSFLHRKKSFLEDEACIFAFFSRRPRAKRVFC
ncbi:hypothetical protein HMPREF9151_00702 [Hoylesella saccharolytica F0055]|uniref:Uncharacterized protein n=1 Tax=Hoylesella saccharolytica F0055 TaxID=1127699 RepID=L1NHG6_9BACT|nr:hypothetical protein HMPREF9151_00702 [Hoylesella saccharolytica F0055]